MRFYTIEVRPLNNRFTIDGKTIAITFHFLK